MSWTDERVATLKKLWSEGYSASQIAGRLGSVTRNAVIGKVLRLGLSGRAKTSRMKSHRPKQQRIVRKPAATKQRRTQAAVLEALFDRTSTPYAEPAEELVIPLNARKSLQELTDSHCRWPIGDPQSPDFHFCGRARVNGLPYCEFHSRRAFEPPKPAKKKKEEVHFG